jgi:hypothetical protein
MNGFMLARRLLALITMHALASCAAAQQPAGDVTPAAPPPIAVPTSELGRGYQLVGMLHQPLGRVLTVQGVVAGGRSKGDSGDPHLRVQRIDGVATQEDLLLPIRPFWADPEDPDWNGSRSPPLAKLDTGACYAVKGWGTGEFIGLAVDGASGDVPEVQSAGFSFHESFVVYKAARINPPPHGPADFEGRRALLGGIARSQDGRAFIQGDGWRLLADPASAWPAWIEGKPVEGLGTIRAGEAKDTFTLEGGATRPVRLGDQIGRNVELRGLAWSMNGEWWLEYRGIDLHVENMKEPIGVQGRLHACPVVVRGVLGEAALPPPDPRSFSHDRKNRYIVRNASLAPLDELLGPERVAPTAR